jgi:hypothetical protein
MTMVICDTCSVTVNQVTVATVKLSKWQLVYLFVNLASGYQVRKFEISVTINITKDNSLREVFAKGPKHREH